MSKKNSEEEDEDDQDQGDYKPPTDDLNKAEKFKAEQKETSKTVSDQLDEGKQLLKTKLDLTKKDLLEKKSDLSDQLKKPLIDLEAQTKEFKDTDFNSLKTEAKSKIKEST